MDYKKIYDLIINKANSSDRKKGGNVYYELHHIVPKCFGGSDEKDNLVLLTAREHYVCHKILYKLYPNNKGLALAYYCMTYTMQGLRKIKLSSRDYQEVKSILSFFSKRENLSPETLRKMSESHSGENNHFYNKKHTEKTLQKLRKPKTEESKHRNRQSHLGKKASNEALINMSKAQTGESNGFFNKKHKKETINLMSEKAKVRFSNPENNPMYGKTGDKSPVFGKKQSKEQILKRMESSRKTKEEKKELIRQERAIMIF